MGLTNNSGRSGSGASNIKGQYKEFVINDIIRHNSKPVQAWNKLCAQFQGTNNILPEDFPERTKAIIFMRNWRQNNKDKIRTSMSADEVDEADGSDGPISDFILVVVDKL